jgi:cytochrome c biogenesis protein CcmG, thiol:disulfide interchange protein DsbE
VDCSGKSVIGTRGAGDRAEVAGRGSVSSRLILLVQLTATVACADARRVPAPVDVGKAAPPYRAVAANGDSVSLAGLRGKPVLLNVWATWCHPCRDEIPELQQIFERYRDRGLVMVGVSVDAAGHEEAIEAFALQYGMTYPVWRDPDEIVSATFLVVGVPATFLIDRTGIVRWKKTGPIGQADTSLTAAIERSIASQSSR